MHAKAIILLLSCVLVLTVAQEYRLNHNRYDLVLRVFYNGTASFTNTTLSRYYAFPVGANVTYVSYDVQCDFKKNTAISSSWCRLLLFTGVNYTLFQRGNTSKPLHTSDFVNDTIHDNDYQFSYDPSAGTNVQAVQGDMVGVLELFSQAVSNVASTPLDMDFEVNMEILVLSDGGGNVALNAFWVVLLFLGGFILCVGCTICVMVTTMCIVISGKISYFDRDINWGALFIRQEQELDYDNLTQNQQL
jgi:hypothetical protein